MLGLAMPEPDDHPFAEERRLFYVALTRARREVTMIAVAGQESPFVLELVQSGHVVVAEGHIPPLEVCRCGRGTLTRRSGKYGPFLSCSAPACDVKQARLPRPPARPRRR